MPVCYIKNKAKPQRRHNMVTWGKGERDGKNMKKL